MELTGRIGRLERLVETRDPNRPQAVPEHWTRYGDDGRMIGPGPAERPTLGQLAVFETMQAMDGSVLGD